MIFQGTNLENNPVYSPATTSLPSSPDHVGKSPDHIDGNGVWQLWILFFKVIYWGHLSLSQEQKRRYSKRNWKCENQVKAIFFACRLKPKVSHHTWESKRIQVWDTQWKGKNILRNSPWILRIPDVRSWLRKLQLEKRSRPSKATFLLLTFSTWTPRLLWEGAEEESASFSSTA